MDIIQKELGHGPARFVVTKQERSIQEQIDSLSMEERMCFHNLKVKWEEEPSNVPFHDEWYLRFARCSPGGMEKYNEKSAWNVMLKFNRRYDTLRCSHIEKQLYTKVCNQMRHCVNLDRIYQRMLDFV